MSETPIDRLEFGDDRSLDAEYMRALAGATYGAATPGEVLHAARTIRRRGGDRDSYIATWTELARRSADHAGTARQQARRATARPGYLRAYNYLRAAEYVVPAGALGTRRDRHAESVAQFDAAMALLPHPVEPIDIPYEGGVALPGHLFLVDDDGVPRPTVVVCGGQGGSGEEMYLLAGVPEAIARGLNVIAFHGPGQRGLQLRHPKLTFRPDSEVMIDAVLDYAQARPEVAGDRIGLYGMSFGGYLAPRAAAHSRRVRALVANAPILDLLGILLDGVTGDPARHAAKQLHTAPWSTRTYLETYVMWHHGVSTIDDLARHAAEFTLSGLVEQIACPTLSVAAMGETDEAMRQAREFHDGLRVPKQFITLTAESGADGHCGIGNVPYTSGLVYDWLAEQLR